MVDDPKKTQQDRHTWELTEMGAAHTRDLGRFEVDRVLAQRRKSR